MKLRVMRSALLTAMLLAGGVWLFAQQPSPAPQTTFRTRVDAVTVDVIATDKQGKPASTPNAWPSPATRPLPAP